MLPNALSPTADSVSVSSPPLELCTFAWYLTVAQPAVVPTKVLVSVAVLGASPADAVAVAV